MANLRTVFAVAFAALALVMTGVVSRNRRFPNICSQPHPRSEGVCTIEIEGFYYDARTNDCQMYVVGGCRTTPGQSFGSRKDCLATCVHGTRRIQDLRMDD